MRLKIFLAIMAFMMLGGIAGAQGPSPDEGTTDSVMDEALAREGLTMQDLQNITSYYYMSPNPEMLISAVKVMITQDEFVADAMHFAPFAHFVSTVAHNDRYFLSKLINLEQDYLGLEGQVVEKLVSEAQDFISPAADSPQDLDYLWAEFCATGSDEPVNKIISLLGSPKPNSMDAMVTWSAAEWSLKANAKQHKRVYEIVEKAAAAADGALKGKLEDILKPEVKQE